MSKWYNAIIPENGGKVSNFYVEDLEKFGIVSISW